MKIRLSPVTFTVVYCISYIAVLALDAPLFRYYPAVKQFAWEWQLLEGVGPAMAWYGLMASAALVALGAATVVPSQPIAARLRNYLWCVPLAAVLGCVFLMRQFFFR
jgi:hypothetical protein